MANRYLMAANLNVGDKITWHSKFDNEMAVCSWTKLDKHLCKFEMRIDAIRLSKTNKISAKHKVDRVE